MKRQFTTRSNMATVTTRARVCREGNGDHAAAGESQQLYEPLDLHGVQRPPASSHDALLSLDVASPGALAGAGGGGGGRHVIFGDDVECVVGADTLRTFDTPETLCAVTYSLLTLYTPELSMGWVDLRVGLG